MHLVSFWMHLDLDLPWLRLDLSWMHFNSSKMHLDISWMHLDSSGMHLDLSWIHANASWMYPDSFHIFPRSIQYESSRTSEVGGNDFWELDGPNDVKICLVVDKGDVQPPNEKKKFLSNFVFFCVKFFFYILLNFS